MDLANIIAHQVEKPLVISKINLDSQPDTELERKLREIKFKQELRKDWILFIARDIVIFSTLILFFLIITGYSLLTLLRAC
ncbi:MAG: hypothetical protein KME21_00665 [Desmonostoc vinosum HA7617-LM4]|nr:hypothetical protein [Desmonostoc vinosum HA7617-LM4]